MMPSNRRRIPTLCTIVPQASDALLGIIKVYTCVRYVYTYPTTSNTYGLFATTDQDKVHIKYLLIKLLTFAHSSDTTFQHVQPYIVIQAFCTENNPVVLKWGRDHNSDGHWKLFTGGTSVTVTPGMFIFALTLSNSCIMRASQQSREGEGGVHRRTGVQAQRRQSAQNPAHGKGMFAMS